MAAAATGSCCLARDLDSLEGDAVFGGCKPAAKMNAQDSFKLRIRKGNAADTSSRRGPVVARHPVMGLSGVVEKSGQVANRISPPHFKFCGTPPPIYLGEGSCPRTRSPSIPRSRPSSPGSNSTRRPPSPGALDPAVLKDVKDRARRVPQARLYLLQQTGPNSFLVGGDSPEHKYHVVIGPQTCSCGREQHCLHLLFVMLRVFQVPESDSRIYAKELKNYEVESLFRNYQQRRNSRVNVPQDDVRKDMVQPHCGSGSPYTLQSEGSSRCVVQSAPASDVKPAEEEICPICLLEMVDGESLVACVTGCRNRLHHHCMAIWAEECYQQNETVLCPLCRHPWVSEAVAAQFQTRNMEELGCKRWVSAGHHQSTFHSWNPVDPSPMIHEFGAVTTQQLRKSHHKALDREQPCTSSTGAISLLNSSDSGSSGYNSPSPGSAEVSQEVPAHAAVIPSEQLPIVSELAEVFGADLVLCLYSQEWKTRELALRKLMKEIVKSHFFETEEGKRRVLRCGIKIVTLVVADPVLSVYCGCICCFRTLLNFSSCDSKCQLEELQELIRPIIRILLLKCADRNRRTSLLSAEVLVELAKGQSGNFALGKYVSDNPNCGGLEALELVLGCVLEEWNFDTVSWQWLAGRLIVLDNLMQGFPDEFWLQCVPLYPNESGYKLRNYNRLITVVEFSFRALRSPHSTVAKWARHVFIISSIMTTRERGVFNQVLKMLSDLESDLQIRLRKLLHKAATEYISQSQVAEKGSRKIKAARLVTERCCRQCDLQNVSSLPQNTSYQREECQSMVSPIVRRSGRALNVACQTGLGAGSGTSPPYPKDMPLTLPKIRNNKPQRLQHIPGFCPVQIPLTRQWSGSGLKFLRFLKNKKQDELLPSKPELNGICQGTCSPVDQGYESQLMEARRFSFGSLCSKITVPTTCLTPCTTSIQEDKKACQELQEEVILPLDLNDLGSRVECDIPSVPGLKSPLELDVSAIHLQDKNVEGKVMCSSYLEGLDWKRGQLLGTGAFSSCYQARDLATGTLMAVKQVPFCRNSEEEQANIELGIREEIVTMSKLRHENIVRILGATKQGSHFNLFVEWMAGGSVAGMLDRYGPFNEEVIVCYTKQILEGLSYLHDNHILHRDLKGANLLVDSTGRHLRIGDFGTAACLVSQTTVSGEFQGQLLGTIAFMAPEVLRGEHYGRSCDVWSVGCCMIEMASSKPPWKENCMSNHLALIYKIASSKDPPSIPDVLSWAVKDLALQCLHINSEQRPSAKELLHHCCFVNWQA